MTLDFLQGIVWRTLPQATYTLRFAPWQVCSANIAAVSSLPEGAFGYTLPDSFVIECSLSLLSISQMRQWGGFLLLLYSGLSHQLLEPGASA